jgi:ABC-type transport system substrate-binding protein
VVGLWKDNLGVEVHWHSLPWAEYLDRTYKAPPPVYVMGWLGDYPDPDNFLRVAVQLHSAWRHERYIEAIEQARCSSDQAQRMALYAQAERILAEEVPLLPLGYQRSHLLIKPWVKRYPISAVGGAFWKDVIIDPH